MMPFPTRVMQPDPLQIATFHFHLHCVAPYTPLMMIIFPLGDSGLQSLTALVKRSRYYVVG